MIVYRIEHPETECGPWGHWNSLESPTEMDLGAAVNFDELLHHCTDNSFPVVWRAFPKFKWGMVCGCPSLGVLLKWFPKEIWQQFKHHGFKIRKFNVNPLFVSDMQIVFKRDKAKLLAEVEPKTMKSVKKALT